MDGFNTHHAGTTKRHMRSAFAATSARAAAASSASSRRWPEAVIASGAYGWISAQPTVSDAAAMDATCAPLARSNTRAHPSCERDSLMSSGKLAAGPKRSAPCRRPAGVALRVQCRTRVAGSCTPSRAAACTPRPTWRARPSTALGRRGVRPCTSSCRQARSAHASRRRSDRAAAAAARMSSRRTPPRCRRRRQLQTRRCGRG